MYQLHSSYIYYNKYGYIIIRTCIRCSLGTIMVYVKKNDTGTVLKIFLSKEFILILVNFINIYKLD